MAHFCKFYPWLIWFTPAMSQNLVQPDLPLPYFSNKILLQIILIFQSNRDSISCGTLYSFLQVSRACYSMAFQALYSCLYITTENSNCFKRLLVKFRYGIIVKKLRLRNSPYQPHDEVLIIQDCKDKLE